MRHDQDIKRDLEIELRSDPRVRSGDIVATVKDGWVTLEGEVDWHYERDEAKWTAYRQRGVVGVSNLIDLRPATVPTEVLRDIVEAFKRNASIGANQITVELAGNEVRLRGVSRSGTERDEAKQVVWNFPGITKVDNGIVVQPE